MPDVDPEAPPESFESDEEVEGLLDVDARPEDDEPRGSPSAWPKASRQNLTRLGAIMGQFLRMAPFDGNSKIFTTFVVNPVYKAAGTEATPPSPRNNPASR